MFSPCELRRICLEGKFDLKYLDAVEQLIQEEEKFLDRAAVDLPSSLAVFPYKEKVYDRKHGFRLLRDSVEICEDGVLVGFDVDHMAEGTFSVSWTWNDQPKTAVLRWHSRRCHHEDGWDGLEPSAFEGFPEFESQDEQDLFEDLVCSSDLWFDMEFYK